MIVDPRTKSQTPSVRAGLRVRRVPDWEAAGLAGLFGGAAFMALEMILAPLSGRSVWDLPMFVVRVLFDGTVVNPSAGSVLLLGLFIHFSLSLIYARLLVTLMLFRHEREALPIGAAFGLLLFLFNFYVLGAAVPRLADGRSWIWLVCHVLFGIIVAEEYIRLENVSYE